MLNKFINIYFGIYDMQFPYKHPIYNPNGEEYTGDIYSKLLLEKEYERLNNPEDEEKNFEVDTELERSVKEHIYSQFDDYLTQKGTHTPILHELVETYISQKLMAIRMNKLFYKYGVMKLKIIEDPETGLIKEYYHKTPLLKDFNELNAAATSTLKQINDIISGIKVEVSNTSVSFKDLMEQMNIQDADYQEDTNKLYEHK
ncbi:MAG: hypothetical protein ACOCP8_05925 [archaeon]